jgi:hypothetical protein
VSSEPARPVASDALNAALSVAGARASVRLARFTNGKVEDVLVADGTVLADAPLEFDMKQIDVGYDLAPKRGRVNGDDVASNRDRESTGGAGAAVTVALDGDTIVNVGSTDVFHGPTASFGAAF